ncbi:MAG: hypothetical protein FJ125_05880 [Deltaproteobacteria bacterium]|nr:hypothetical protein [Deltaproteobacteria bacterium]
MLGGLVIAASRLSEQEGPGRPSRAGAQRGPAGPRTDLADTGGTRRDPRSRTPPVAPIRTPAGDNRRKVRTGIEVFLDLKSAHGPWMGFSENLSEGGVFVATLEPLLPGEQVELR